MKLMVSDFACFIYYLLFVNVSDPTASRSLCKNGAQTDCLTVNTKRNFNSTLKYDLVLFSPFYFNLPFKLLLTVFWKFSERNLTLSCSPEVCVP